MFIKHYNEWGDFLKTKLKSLVICIAIPLLVGGVSAFITMGAMETFESVEQPALSPPSWLFPVVWTLLYILMGIASYLILRSSASSADIKMALKLYGIQLFFNFFWSIIFFNFRLYVLAFIWLAVLWVAVLFTIILFYRISKASAYLMVPYLIWLTFAAYLNLAIAILN